MFSFNNPLGPCPDCNGLGFIQRIDPDLIIPDQDKSINEKCLSNVFATMEYTSFYWQVIRALAEKYGADMDTPYKDCLLYTSYPIKSMDCRNTLEMDVSSGLLS